jgi:hypothetical protein
MRAMRTAALLLVLPLAACNSWDVFGPGDRDFEGYYSYAGTVDGVVGDAVLGSFTVTRQRGRSAEVAIDWEYLEQNETIIHITTDRAADARISSDGRITFDFEGDLFIGGDVVRFRLEHDGRLRGNTMTGYWRLTTDLPTDDAGSFTARR